jgi:hypothetical protein
MLSTRYNTHAAEPILRLNNSESEKRGCTSLLHDRRCFTIKSIVRRSHIDSLAVANSYVVRSATASGRDLHTEEQATEHKASKLFGYEADIL